MNLGIVSAKSVIEGCKAVFYTYCAGARSVAFATSQTAVSRPSPMLPTRWPESIQAWHRALQAWGLSAITELPGYFENSVFTYFDTFGGKVLPDMGSYSRLVRLIDRGASDNGQIQRVVRHWQ